MSLRLSSGSVTVRGDQQRCAGQRTHNAMRRRANRMVRAFVMVQILMAEESDDSFVLCLY